MRVTAAAEQRQGAIKLARARPFRLGAVQVRPATREIVGPHGREVMEPRVMQVLVALAEAKGEIVTRDDLTERCWEGRIVGEDAISRVISRLRKHTEGVGRDGWKLETITKVGYRLVAAGESGELTAVGDAMETPRPPTSRRSLIMGGAGLVFAAVGGGVVWWRRSQVSPRAKELYEKGKEAARQGQPEPNAQAIAFLREAVAEQPDYAAAWGALSQAYLKSLNFTEPARQDGVSAQARAAARRALDLDADEPNAAATIALLTPTYGNWIEAEKQFLWARTVHPNEPLVELGYNKLLLGVGRLKAALDPAERGHAADPYSPYHYYALALTLWSLGRNEEAEQKARKALDLWPRHLANWFLLFYMLTYGGRADEALAMAANVGARPLTVPQEDIELSTVGARALLSRRPADIETAVQANLQAATRGAGFAENAIQFLSAVGRVDAAFGVARGMYFNEGFSVGAQRYSATQGRFNPRRERSTHQLFMPTTAALRADPRFPKLMADLGVADYWKTTGRAPDDPAWAKTVGVDAA